MGLIKAILMFLSSVIIFNVISILAFPVQLIRKSFKNDGSLTKYFINLAIGEDQRAGSYIYGTQDFTVSSMCYLYGVFRNNTFARYFMHFIDFFAKLITKEHGHCKNNYLNEIKELYESARKGE